MERRTPWLGYLCVILSAVIFGCMPLGANFLYAQGVTPMSLVFLRNLLSLPVLARLPINPDIASLFDEGKMAQADVSAVLPAAELMAKA